MKLFLASQEWISINKSWVEKLIKNRTPAVACMCPMIPICREEPVNISYSANCTKTPK